MLIKEIMDTDVAECTEDAPVAEVYEMIQQSPKNYVVVIDSGQHRVPIGIVNEHSICENIVKYSQNTKGLSAGNVMSVRMHRVYENQQVADCRDAFRNDADAIVVVNDRREFRGVVDPVEIESSDRRHAAVEKTSSFFSGMLGQAVPAAVEIPAFGWLK